MESFFWLQSCLTSLQFIIRCFDATLLLRGLMVEVSMKHFLFVELYPFVGRGSFFCQLNMLAFASFSITEHIFD